MGKLFWFRNGGFVDMGKPTVTVVYDFRSILLILGLFHFVLYE